VESLSHDARQWLYGLAYWIAASDKTIHPAEAEWLDQQFGNSISKDERRKFENFSMPEYFSHTIDGVHHLSEDEKAAILPELHNWLVTCSMR
jgi:hypothetical protein